MSRPACPLKIGPIQLSDEPVVFNYLDPWNPAGAHIAHSPVLFVGSREDPAKQLGQRDVRPTARQPFFPLVWQWIAGRVDRLKRRHSEPQQGVQDKLDTPTQVGLTAIGHIHHYAAEMFSASLAVAQALLPVAEDTMHQSLAHEVALYHLTSAYLQAMLTVVDASGAEIMDNLERPLASLGVAQRSRIDQVSEAYLQQVRGILQRKETVHGEKGTKPVGVGAADPIRHS